MDGWPEGHTIGVYLSDGVDHHLVATARSVSDVPLLFRGLATKWEDSASVVQRIEAEPPDSAHFY